MAQSQGSRGFARLGAGGFALASKARRDTVANPFVSVLSRKAVELALTTESFPVFTSSVDVPDVAENAKVLQGQAIKSFLNHVRPSALERIERFVGGELAALPLDSRSCLNDLKRLQILSTAWQALNDCLPQFQGTLEDIREVFDSQVDELRLSLVLQESRVAEHMPVLKSYESSIHDEESRLLLEKNNNSIVLQQQQKKGRSGSIGVNAINSCLQTPSAQAPAVPSVLNESTWAPAGNLGIIQAFWNSTNQLQNYKMQDASAEEHFLEKIRTVRLPSIMTSIHQLVSTITGISRRRGRILIAIWRRAMILVDKLCHHAKVMQTHHQQVVRSLEEELQQHYEYLHLNDRAGNRYQHELRVTEIDQQSKLSTMLSETSTELKLLQERKNNLARVKKTLKRLIEVYDKKRHSHWRDEERSALESRISTVTMGSLSSAMDKQQERLRKAELAAANSDLLAKMCRVTELLSEVKSKIRNTVGSSVRKDVAIQASDSDNSWTVQEGSARKLAPSHGWWTLHRNSVPNGLGARESSKGKGRRLEHSKFDLSGNGTGGARAGIPAKFGRLLTVDMPTKPVRSMTRITFLKMVHAIYGTMMESWVGNFTSGRPSSENFGRRVSSSLSRVGNVVGGSSGATADMGGKEASKIVESRNAVGSKSSTPSTSEVLPTLIASEGWESATAVSDFVYDYLLLQFGISELSEPKLLQLLATTYRMRNKVLRAKTFSWFCGMSAPTDVAGQPVKNLPNQYEEDALRFYLQAYAQLQSAHPTGRCIEVVKKSMLFAELEVAIDVVYDIFGTETDSTQQSIIDSIRNMSEELKVEKSMLGIDQRTRGRNKGNLLRVINVDIVLDLWLTRWTMALSRTRKRFQILFVASDVNEDGRLSYREFSSVVRAIAPSIESYQIAELFRGCLRQTSSGGAEIDCDSFTDFMTRSTTLMAPTRWEGQIHEGRADSVDVDDHDLSPSCMQMYGPPASHYYRDVSRTVRLLRESSVRYRDIIRKHLDWIVKHAKTPEEKWDSEHCDKRLGHFDRLFEHALDGPDSAELAWQAFRLLRHETETIRRNRTMLSHTMAPIHLLSRFRSKMTQAARKMKSVSGTEAAAASTTLSHGDKRQGLEHGIDGMETDLHVQVFSYVRWHHIDKLARVIDFGEVEIDVVNRPHGNSLLHVACQNGHLDIVRMLCRKGISVNTQNKRGNTALHFSRYYDYSEIFRTLRENGADDTLRNHDSETCYELRAQGV